LDKFVMKQGIQEYLPASREVDLTNPMLQTKGLIVKGIKKIKQKEQKEQKENNITNTYEDKDKTKVNSKKKKNTQVIEL
jgi:hypothetical protein